jgi:hypothetical protein
MKTFRATNYLPFILIVITIGFNMRPVFGQVQIERRSGTAVDNLFFTANLIEPSNGWHYTLINANCAKLLLMVEVYLTYDPDREINRYITFSSSEQTIQFGVGLAALQNNKVPAKAYELQIYASDTYAFETDKLTSDMVLSQSERIENYIDEKQSCELGKRIVLGEILLEYMPWNSNQNTPERSGVIQIYPKQLELVAKVSVVIYGEDKN